MYGYRPSTDANHLAEALNSISSSLSSIDTIGRRTTRASVDNLITTRSHSITSASHLWKADREERYSTARSGTRAPGSEIYYGKEGSLKSYCLDPKTPLNFLLVPLLIVTIARQIFDFLGQIWLQIIINFFTILILIFALFGIKQARISYLAIYAAWAFFNSLWNLAVISAHSKLKDVGITEEALSLFTGTTSWWHSNGPGCSPFSINNALQQTTISALQPNLITGCRLDYHLIESAQAALHSFLSFITSLLACCLALNIKRNPPYSSKSRPKTDGFYRLNNLNSNGHKVNQNPSPIYAATSRATSNFDSLRRANNKSSLRSSRHSISSVRSRRRPRHSTEAPLPSPRGSTSSVQRSQQYCSLSSRRSSRRERRDNSSLTYAVTGDRTSSRSKQRTRLSSLSSADYLPSYQPPHSSRANLLSSYGDISSIDSYNNRNPARRSKRSSGGPPVTQGNTNPIYSGSRSSVYSQNNGGNKYDDLSYIYGNNSASKNGESVYGDGENIRRGLPIYQQNPDTTGKRNSAHQQRGQHSTSTRKSSNHDNHDKLTHDENGRSKTGIANGTFNSFINHTDIKSQQSGEIHSETNNNYLTLNYQDRHDRGTVTSNDKNTHNHQPRHADSSVIMSNGNSQQHMYDSHNSMYPIYSNHTPNGNSETPI